MKKPDLTAKFQFSDDFFHITLEGILVLEEYLQIVNVLDTHPKSVHLRRGLFDLSAVQLPLYETVKAFQFASHDLGRAQQIKSPVRYAYVVPAELEETFAEHNELINSTSGNLQVKFFPDLFQAKKWLRYYEQTAEMVA